MSKKPNFEHNFCPNLDPQIFFPLIVVRQCCYKLSLYASYRKINDPNSRKWWKTSFWTWYKPIRPKCRPLNFFSKNLVLSVTRYHDQLSSWTISEKTNDPILRERSNGRTDGQTDKSDFIERCPTNVGLSIRLQWFWKWGITTIRTNSIFYLRTYRWFDLLLPSSMISFSE